MAGYAGVVGAGMGGCWFWGKGREEWAGECVIWMGCEVVR